MTKVSIQQNVVVKSVPLGGYPLLHGVDKAKQSDEAALCVSTTPFVLVQFMLNAIRKVLKGWE